MAYYRASNEKGEFQKLANTVSNIILALSVPACVGMFMLSREIILIFSGAEFLDAIPAMRFMCVDLLFSSLNGFLAWQILAPCNKEKWLFFATIMGAFVDFVLNMALIPSFGTSGAAAATVLAEMVVLLLCSLAGREFISLRGVWKYLWQYLLASLPIIPICYLTQRYVQGSLAVTGISVVLSVIAYAGMLILLNNPYARTYIQEFFRLLHLHKGEKRHGKD
ncbi:MAG: polysaccharide biosynthesis C-terminal domain-containing protein [Lachnospiraceae bacterium]|nr:polysaccharide biosynthesis C-terminal domain-containing protein [Lachnospiraceae bacterium]